MKNSNNNLLNCSNVENARKCIANITRTAWSDLHTKITRSIEEWDQVSEDLESKLERDILSAIDKKLIEIIWFHGTRTMWPDKLKSGIVPLGKSLPLVWMQIAAVLGETPSQNNARKLRIKMEPSITGHFGHLYYMKINDKDHHGPYGYLIRDGFFSKNNGQHDYLGIPEIVEDIFTSCNGYFPDDIIAKYKSMTKPCIVHFKQPKNYDGSYAIGSMLRYAHNGIPTYGTCFMSPGEEISKDRIVTVEILA